MCILTVLLIVFNHLYDTVNAPSSTLCRRRPSLRGWHYGNVRAMGSREVRFLAQNATISAELQPPPKPAGEFIQRSHTVKLDLRDGTGKEENGKEGRGA